MAANLFAEIIVHMGHYPLGSLLLVWTILKDWIKVPYTHYLSLIYTHSSSHYWRKFQFTIYIFMPEVEMLDRSGQKLLTSWRCTVTSAGFTFQTDRLLHGSYLSKTLQLYNHRNENFCHQLELSGCASSVFLMLKKITLKCSK